jgi:hypothetical protein
VIAAAVARGRRGTAAVATSTGTAVIAATITCGRRPTATTVTGLAAARRSAASAGTAVAAPAAG